MGYEVWSRVLTPGHTLVHIQCWNWEAGVGNAEGVVGTAPRARKDMEVDFEPLFDILHSESCDKNQAGPGWCFYMKLKPLEVRERLSENRLKMQQATRDGNFEYVRQHLDDRIAEVSEAELK